MLIHEKIAAAQADGRPFYSFEFFAPKTEAGMENLFARFDRMAQLEPAFIDITWGAGGSTAERSLEIATTAQSYFGLDVMLHLTCTNMPRGAIDEALDHAYRGGVRNILALRGDPPEGSQAWEECDGGFRYAIDLTRHIRRRFGDAIGVAVSGYPEGHPEAPDLASDIAYLRAKVEAGADFVVTQLFYDVDGFCRFVDQCRAAGITVPIIPGLLPIQTYGRFQRIVELTGTKVPEAVAGELAARRQDDAAVQEYGIQLCAQMCRELLDRGVPGFHFYTMNLETSVVRTLEALGLADDCRTRRALPWRPSTAPGRGDETVRPIFWSNRPRSYLARTSSWDDFPNGRWGDNRSPTFGSLGDYYLTRRRWMAEEGRQKRREWWGEPTSAADVAEVFRGYLRGAIPALPWSEAVLQEESRQISTDLEQLNGAGLLTINSQPAVNGADSADPVVGWGGPGGFVFQKAYLEFFIAPRQLEKLEMALRQYPSLTYQAVNVSGEFRANFEEPHVNAVTWGVFPGREILQPTVVDAESFRIWKDEAFALWLAEWASLYPEGSPARDVLRGLHGSYYLMNIVENDFVNGDIMAVFRHAFL